ncbi:MAG: 16S rRNA (cytidine1402-2'-O)-methyltransferase [Pelagibacterales bacterium]|nr:16S rRNA (cytidine1402-2'-O)-methyltransferase [Pelagibacterales bacterium]
MDKNKEQTISAGLYLVATPIGNMEDITYRALNILKRSDTILCEDTRRSGKLLSYFKIKKKLMAYHKYNESKVSNKIIDLIKNNNIISLISDAGTPAISDPGKILINKCLKENLKICPIPGPSAVTTAISISGFSDQYLFYGFLTKKEKELENVLNSLSHVNYSLVFFIPAIKINFYLNKFKFFFSGRKIVIAKEMTKIYEQFFRDKIESIPEMPNKIKGELTVVISEKINQNKITEEVNESVKVEIKKMIKKYSHKDVVDFISKKENIKKKLIYDYCLTLKK